MNEKQTIQASIKLMAKENYEKCKRTKKELMENYDFSSNVTLKTIDACCWVFAGLYNGNKEQFEKGLKKYQKYTLEGLELSAVEGCSFVEKDTDLSNYDSFEKYDDSEAVRQMGREIKKDYDNFTLMGKMMFS